MSATDEVTIRDAGLEDRAAIREVTLAAYEQYATLMTPLHWRNYHQHLLQTLDDVDPTDYIVAELGGEVVGCVRLVPPTPPDTRKRQPGDEWPEVSKLAVVPHARGKGVASALLDECIRRARASGATTLGLHTEETMAVALEMYRRRGFVRAPETDFYPDRDSHVMGFRRDLDDVEV
jgi:ribosomal protein S18 acetylase RimI-like enzyme